MKDAQLKIENYSSHRCDRESRIRGGCLTYIHNSICVGETQKFDNQFCEVTIVPLEKTKSAVITLYRPPKCPHGKFQQVMDFIQNFINTVQDNWSFVITGDFNFPNINWEKSQH